MERDANSLFDIIAREIEHKNKFMEDMERALLDMNEEPEDFVSGAKDKETC